ncbi:E3 ubiquitin-protein ligase rnf213-alpha-like [Sphaeramia orbicularis]|uniref:E3 ubiquitin-protein ligase rnf213-alpha-like n=1 Tax=Sphaeramia orbicularis TaxID=375764 RepID=UPI00117F9A77|nr:E3 ubiquitin-protein ligase rnf213-alpha-like [Sphaeramia orbicularis]
MHNRTLVSDPDSTAPRTSANKGTNNLKDMETGPIRPTMNTDIPVHDRLTIHFHAVLSIDFNFDPGEDFLFIRGGSPIGTWIENIAELHVKWDHGQRGFLVEGSLLVRKSQVHSVPVPYKYVVFKRKERKYVYEFVDSTYDTNRCLYVKPYLISKDGTWHQYDDTIWTMSSATQETPRSDQNMRLMSGRVFAGKVMLENMLDPLKSWTDMNWKSFVIQLRQFFDVYGEPNVYKQELKRHSLNYGTKDVREMLKNFLLEKMVLQGEDENGEDILHHKRMAVILLFVQRHNVFKIELNGDELNELCYALTLPNLDKDHFLQFWTQFSQDVRIVQNVPEMLVSLMNAMKKEGLPHWILVLPVLHLLTGTTKAFETPNSGKWKYGQSWAGLQSIEKPESMSKEHKKAVLTLMESHRHLLEVDAFAVRSCLFLMPFEELMDCSVDMNPELLDLLHAFTNKVPENISRSHNMMKKLFHSILPCRRNSRGKNRKTAVELLEKICKQVKAAKSKQDYIRLSVTCMNLVAFASDFVVCNDQQETPDEERKQRYPRDMVDKALGIMRTWIYWCFRDKHLGENPVEIEIWNDVVSIVFKDDACTKKWKEWLINDFEGKFSKESAERQMKFYCSNIEKLDGFNPHVACSIEICATDALTCLCQNKSEGKVLEMLKKGQFKKAKETLKIHSKLDKLIVAIIEKSWPKDRHGKYQEDEEVIFQHLLSWAPITDILQLYEGRSIFEKLSEDSSHRMKKAVSSFMVVNNQLIRGDIKISLLKFILGRRETFLKLLKIDLLCEKEQYKNEDKMQSLLEHRHEEVKAVHHQKELTDVFLDKTNELKEFLTVDVVNMEERRKDNVEVMPLNQFMKVRPFDQPSSRIPAVTHFILDEEIRTMAEVLYKFRDSGIFHSCCEKQAGLFARSKLKDNASDEQVADIKATPKMIRDEVLVKGYDEYKDIYIRLKTGSLTFEEVNKLFRISKQKYEQLKDELDIMCRIDPSADKQWIHGRVEQIKQYHELHLALASAETITRVKETLGLQGDFRVLETLTKANHEDFVREQLNRIDDDLMQAKMDLVEITELRRNCLHELSLRGDFIKWLKDALKDINELKVFVDLASISAGENDEDIHRVSCFHDAVLGYSSLLYELKPDSDFHTLKTALHKLWGALQNDGNLPKKLRDSARYLEWLKTVKDSHGSVERSSLSLASAINDKGIYLISAQTVKKLSLDTVLKLLIPEGHDDGQIRSYSLEDLRELQNKLMLMSGKGHQGKKQVDHFVEVFDGAQRLAKAFIALYTAGNPLFRCWEARIRCCINSNEPSITMDFKVDGGLNAVTVKGSVDEQLPELCRKMEKYLDDWMNFVEDQRSHHYYLNYYTAEQIVNLCTNLSQQKLISVSDQVLMLLSFIKPDCTAADLLEAQEELKILEMMPENEVASSDFTMELHPLPGHIDQASGLQKIDLIWDTYMKDMKSFLPHILDVQTLGRLLEKLANKENSKGTYIHRELPNGLAVGKPNLVVCPHDEVLTSCISVYMCSKNQTLPTYDEVLLCNSTTSYEQVELFLRRCLSKGSRGQKIYTLLYGDLLTYDVSSKVEKFFQEMKMRSRQDYRLVIICSSEREHTYLPSAFSQYKLHMVPQEKLERIQRYLHQHYVVPETQSSAAAAFKDRKRVGVVSSKRAGVGKSLYIKRLYEKLQDSTTSSVMKCIRLIEPKVDENVILQSLLRDSKKEELTMFHFDVTSSVQKGLDEFLFKLLILHYLMDSEGNVWRCSDKELYIIETLEQTAKPLRNTSHQARSANNSFTDVFPNIFCRPPKEVLELEMSPSLVNNEDPLMDDQEFRSAAFQRPYQYLTRFQKHANLDTFKYDSEKRAEGSHVECLQMFLLYCGIPDPSWAELRHFAWFLNLQLQDCENSVFCDASLTGDVLRGFKTFVVDFMILMAKDFATPSLCISDQSPGNLQVDLTGVKDEDLAPFLIRKRWETEPHPYIFFNDDHVSMTFIGFHLKVNKGNSVDAIEPISGKVIRKNVMSIALHRGLMQQRVPFNIDFDRLPRKEKIEQICNVLGIQSSCDPDETYELTTDNILKMLAIHMRFRCGIPVIIMGETGCGKTRLIRFLCELQRNGRPAQNMQLVKVHGGTTPNIIHTRVREAEKNASANKQEYKFDTVLFFDEANTTEAISSIKEVLCDQTVNGESLTPDCGLQIIAACNPYRKHTEEMIKRLESAGLGYRVRAEETDEKLGSIPLRQLVYRVHALPPSMIPLVWDFGQLNDHTEKMYIHQIVQRVVENKPVGKNYVTQITNVLSGSQKYMRTRKDECSFVSLRDVERCMQAFLWFFDNHATFFAELEEFEKKQNAKRNESPQKVPEVRDPVLWSVVMATAVCYYASLENKDDYRQQISKSLSPAYNPGKVKQEISLMQDLFLSGVPIADTIARNNALKENVFMMVLCIELRIPLFLVGKPGSSKSLSKTLVADAMQGQAAHSDLYKRLKQIHLVSFQCSPHSTPEGIINTFKQCGRFQEGKNLKEYTSVVVLDEIGLAEDSPKMPLKTLHPLLEEGCIDDDPQPHKKVGFIGISNWALDPAKMNRGIFVSRGDPDERELIESAKGICSSDEVVLRKVKAFFEPFARAYVDICNKEGNGFFGLRDFYSLIKMIFAVAKVSQRKPTAEEIVKAVLRNFSGRDDVDAVTVFTEGLQIVPNLESIRTTDFVRENIQAVGQEEECRYLLILTKNYAALQILQQTFFSESCQPEIIFGSSFLKDQEYTQICRNINRVKICMETGQTVVLVNLQNLYESLYDALNQYYVYLGGQKYVDLGLGTHRVKCRVHEEFRLVVIEEREVVYKQFPIPLINRLEKHYLDIFTVLKPEQKRTVTELQKWVEDFVSLNSQESTDTQEYEYLPADVFIGYHFDTCASVVLQVTENKKNSVENSDPEKRVLDEAKLMLLKCATPDSVVRLNCSGLPKVESEHLTRVYFEDLNNSCLVDYILAHTKQEVHCSSSFTEVTTFSRLLTASDLKPLEQVLPSVGLLSLQQFDTEQSFLKKIRNFLTTENGNSKTGADVKVLIIQYDFDEASQSANLIASAKYSSINEINKITQENTGSKVFVYFITRLPRIGGGTSYVGFQGGLWRSVHIDDLRRSKDIVSGIKTLQSMTISQMFETKIAQPEAMEVDDDSYTGSEENALAHVVDTTELVRSCVQNAVGMLKDQVEGGIRSTQRVQILLTLLSNDDAITGEFLQIVKKRLHSLLVIHDSKKENWVMKEASDIDALQKGGTFRNTLWKHVQAAVVPVLAQLVSVIDRDQNLDILLNKNCDESFKRLWLDIFGNENLLEIPQLTFDHSSETGTIPVQNYVTLKGSFGCRLPFSWRIKDHLEDLWVNAPQCGEQTHYELEELFWTTPLGQHIQNADQDMQTEFFQCYLQDFITMTMNVTREQDLQLLHDAMNCCVHELKFKLGVRDAVTSLLWVHAAYHEFKNRLQNLSRMMCIEPQLTHDLQKDSSASNGFELVIDVFAAKACVEYLEPGDLDTDAQRRTWLRRVKRLQVPIELICSNESTRHYGEKSKVLVHRVRGGWNRIFSLSLFVEHMLLGIEEINGELAPLFLQQTKKLGKVLERNSDLKSQEMFKAVIDLLRTCKDGAVGHLFRFDYVCRICTEEPQDPIRLPCDHIYCMACIKQWLIPGQMYCPYCKTSVDEDFRLVPCEDTRTRINQHIQLRKRRNAFFVDLVSTVCFKDNTPPCPAVVRQLLSFVMVETSPSENQQTRTKELSPFDDSLDTNPVVRSVLVKLLLKYSFDDVKEYLQQHLTEVEQSRILDKTDKTELYCLYINCLEDSMFESLHLRSVTDEQECFQDESAFLSGLVRSNGPTPETVTVEYLQDLARVRIHLDQTARLFTTETTSTGLQHGGQRGTTAFLNSVVNLCKDSGNNWYRTYLIRKIASQHGLEFVLKLLKDQQMSWLFPEELLQKVVEDSPIDTFLVCGKDYEAIRNAVAKVSSTETVETLDHTCQTRRCSPQQKTVYLLLALYREVTTLYREASATFHPTPERLEVWVTYIQTSTYLPSPEVKAFARALVENDLGPFAVRPGFQRVLVELVVHLAAVLLCGKHTILAPLRRLATAPADMKVAYLPTMPEMLAEVHQALQADMQRIKWYYCKNGHPCVVGNCGLPMREGKCFDCGEKIGGLGHRPVEGFKAFDLKNNLTETGHILGDAVRRNNPDMQDTKGLSSVPFIVIRMFTHMAMMVGVRNGTQPISAIIKPPVREPAEFLFAHLQKDEDHVIRYLGKGKDDTDSIIHLLISSLLEPGPDFQGDELLSTKDARNKWEKEMSSRMTPQLQNLEEKLKEVNPLLLSDSRVSAFPIMKLLFEDPQLHFTSFPQQSLIHNSTVWSCRDRVCPLSLTHIVEQNNGRNTVPLLWKFLHKEAELRLVKHLPDILTLQKNLVRRFHNSPEMICGTIAEFLDSQKADTEVSLGSWYHEHVRTFLTTWNQLRVSLQTNGAIKIPPEFCQKDLDLDSGLAVLLPRRQGLGLCSTALVSYLIGLHNDLVYCADKQTGEETSYKVSAADLVDLHVIRYEVDRDLMPLILSNTQYSIENGKEIQPEYDLPKIQQQILSHFLLGKPLISPNGIPTLIIRQQRNYKMVLEDVKAAVKQEPLPTQSLWAVDVELQSYSEVCDALSTVETALDFLAATDRGPDTPLSSYLEEELQMGKQTVAHVLMALSRCSLKHCVALWQLLASLKSENMLKLNRDPFFDVSDSYKQALGEDDPRRLTDFLSKGSVDTFLMEMHEFLVLELKKPEAAETYRPDWSIKETLVDYVENSSEDVRKNFPDEIMMFQIVETWKFVVAFKQQQRRTQRL